MKPRSLFDKLWERHVIVERGAGEALLYVDAHFVAEGSFHAFGALAKEGRKVRRPRQVFGSPDHFVPTLNRAEGLKGIRDPESRGLVEYLAGNARDYGFDHFGIDDPSQGIIHVIGPELGITQPGLVVTCGDSHTSTHGAFGALAFGIGASQNKQILAAQCLWQKKPKNLRITVDGTLPFGVSAKDLILEIMFQVGSAGATGHAIEYAGSTLRGMDMAQRMTVCNMSIEAGARTGMVAPDDVTFAYLHGRRYAPRGALWDAALADWRTLRSDADARFDREISLNATALMPTVTWGTLPEQALPISAAVPDPALLPAAKQAPAAEALRYMGLQPGTPLEGIKIDRVFIGSCTNGRLEDLRAASEILRGRKAKVPSWVAPGSTEVKRLAEQEGLDKIFLEAGARCASTANRNFEGRQGKGARTHLMSPAMAAAAAVTGAITDVRKLAR